MAFQIIKAPEPMRYDAEVIAEQLSASAKRLHEKSGLSSEAYGSDLLEMIEATHTIARHATQLKPGSATWHVYREALLDVVQTFPANSPLRFPAQTALSRLETLLSGKNSAEQESLPDYSI